MDFSEENLALLRVAAAERLLDSQALAAVALAMKEAPREPVGAILLRRGLCSPEEFLALAEKLDAKLVFCPACQACVSAAPPLYKARCPSCKGPMVLREIPARAPSSPAETEDLPAAFRDPLGAGRYELGEELGRGGLGTVQSGLDRVLGREVAVKQMIGTADTPELVQRFLREGRIAGALSHPGIVPIHDVGVHGAGENRIPYFVMSRIRGQDLATILARLARADQEGPPEEGEDPRKTFTLHRLLGIFQDVCLAVAYAHAQGVVHRDLKPSNVMVGHFGEIFVVDWGLAKNLKSPEEPDAAIPPPGSPSPGDDCAGPPQPSTALTVDGQILGTPAYMAPEQAAGRLDEVDEVSDIYSLGAILYEILTRQPPFEGKTWHAVIEKVRTGALVPPSARSSRLDAPASARPADREVQLPSTVPPELEEVVLKAMALDRAGRYASVMALHDEVQGFLEGEKQREHNRKLALEKVAEGQALVASLDPLRQEMASLQDEIFRLRGTIEPHKPVEEKKPLWDVEDRYGAVREKLVRTHNRAERLFHGALEMERGNPEARAALADLYWDQFRRQEEAGDRVEMVHFKALLREYNDGQYDRELQGDGSLTLATKRYPCRCLIEGRTVEPGELRVLGYHPQSGKSPDPGDPSPGLTTLEAQEPVHLKAHGPACAPEPLEGAHVWLYRYEERERILVPGPPGPIEGIGLDAPPPVREALGRALDALFDTGSPYRPQQGLYLGTTPLEGLPLPMGSYLAVVHKEGFQPLRVPVFLGRLARLSATVTLYGPEEIPEGFLTVPAGTFVFQGDPQTQSHNPKVLRSLEDFFPSRVPVTCAEYLAFLNDRSAIDAREAARRIPRRDFDSGPYWPQDGQGTIHLPTEAWLSEAPEELKEQAARVYTSPVWWREDWPVCAVSWEDAMTFAHWKSGDSGRLFTLLHDVQFEKAGRGTDGRFLPWGNADDPTFCNCIRSHEEGPRVVAVDAFPKDESPYGVRGMAGNVSSWSLSVPGPSYPNWRIICGGSWLGLGERLRMANRAGGMAYNVGKRVGFFLSWVARCPADPGAVDKEGRSDGEAVTGPTDLPGSVPRPA